MADVAIKITVRIDTSDLEQFRELVERAERAAKLSGAQPWPSQLRQRMQVEETRGVAPGACSECAVKAHLLRVEELARVEYATLAGKRGDEILSLKLDLDKWRKEHARREQECEALKNTNDNALAELRRMRGVLERESADHFATRIALRDALRAAAERAREVADYADDAFETAYAKDVREIAVTYDETRAALGLDEIAMPAAPPAAGSAPSDAKPEPDEAATYAREVEEICRRQHEEYARKAGIVPEVKGTLDALSDRVEAVEKFCAANADSHQGVLERVEQLEKDIRLLANDVSVHGSAQAGRIHDTQKRVEALEDCVRGQDSVNDIFTDKLAAQSDANDRAVAELVRHSAKQGNRIAALEAKLAALKEAAPEPMMREFGASKIRVREIAIQPEPNPVPTTPEPAHRRRRFLAGDRVRPAAQEIVYSAVLDEDDSGSVAIQIGSRKYLNVGASALELVKSTTQAKRNSELAFHFHLWNTSMDANVMDSVPEFVRVAAEQLLRDPFGTEYGSVLADAGSKTGGAK
jgi:hypothetical protein